MSLDFELWIDVDTGGSEPHYVDLFDENITHNLAEMAEAAGIYECLWRPDEHGFEYAEQLIEPLTEGLWKLESRPDEFRKYDAPNGWGTYDNFVGFVERALMACRKHPKARVEVCR